MKQRESSLKYFVSAMFALSGIFFSGAGRFLLYLKDNRDNIELLTKGQLESQFDFIQILSAMIIAAILALAGIICLIILLYCLRKIWKSSKTSINENSIFESEEFKAYSKKVYQNIRSHNSEILKQANIAIKLKQEIEVLKKEIDDVKLKIQKYENEDQALNHAYIVQKTNLMKAKTDKIKAELRNIN